MRKHMKQGDAVTNDDNGSANVGGGNAIERTADAGVTGRVGFGATWQCRFVACNQSCVGFWMLRFGVSEAHAVENSDGAFAERWIDLQR